MAEHSARPSVIPTFRYKDNAAAVDFLERAFGFRRKSVVEGAEGTIAHAQLSFGSGIVMLGSGREYERGMTSPNEAGGVTSGVYVVVDDVDAHFERAKSAGVEIVAELSDTDYGSRDYTARDPEGYLWTFGTFDPAEEEA